MLRNHSKGVVAVLLAVGSVTACRADLVVRDDFAAPAGASLIGLDTGFGFAGPWTVNNANNESASVGGPLTGPGGFAGPEHSVQVVSSTPGVNTFSNFTRPINPVSIGAGELWISAWMQVGAPVNQFTLSFGLPTSSPVVSHLNLSLSSRTNGTLRLLSRNLTSPAAKHGLSSDFASLVVLRISPLPGDRELFELWVNPTDSLPATPDASLTELFRITALDTISITHAGALGATAERLGDLRVGRTCADVAQTVPTPSASVLVFSAGLLLRRRR